MLGLTNKTIDVLDRTPPTTLIPGMNVVGSAYLYVRETFIQPKFSAFGLFDVGILLRCQHLMKLTTPFAILVRQYLLDR